MHEPHMMRRVITRYEHDTISVPGDISKSQFASLARYHEKVSSDYYSLGYTSIKLNQYVGVIQVGDTVIEVLPKIDRDTDPEGKPRWRRTLLQMLEVCQKITPRTVGTVDQSTSHHTILDLFLDRYLELVTVLLQQGLVRRYIENEDNVRALKGKILFSQHLAQNIIRPDRWFTRHTIYDRNHQLHGLLKTAILITERFGSEKVRQRAYRILQDFKEFDQFIPTKSFMERLNYNRTNERYRNAVAMAWLLIQSYAPNIEFGKNPVIALMFNMNQLYEETVCRLLSDFCSRTTRNRITVDSKIKIPFWENMKLEPDIVLHYGTKSVVIDTKWKRPKNDYPSPEDLRQVFVYNLYCGSDKAVLLYPGMENQKVHAGMFCSPGISMEHHHGCEIHYAVLNDPDGNLNKQFAPELVERLAPAGFGRR